MAATIPAPLAGKTAIVTGGSRGIGAGIAVDLAHKGCTAIAITYLRNKSLAEDVLSKITTAYPSIKTTAIQADLSSPTFGEDVVSATLKQLGVDKIDIVIANAVQAEVTSMAPLSTHSKELFLDMMTANVWSPIQLGLAAMPHIPRGGRIINISSFASKRAAPDPVAIYSATKAALDSVTRSMARIYAAEKGITINTVAAGITRTEAMEEIWKVAPAYRDYAATLPVAEKRPGEIDDVVQIVSFLCSDGARWICGNYVPANGGSILDLQG